MIDIQKITCSALGTNLYVLTDVASGKQAIVDCPPVRNKQLQFLTEKLTGKLEYIFLTHGHFDHILGLGDVQERFGGKIVIHKNDEECLSDHEKALCRWMPVNPPHYKADVVLQGGEVLELGESRFEVLHTPGHTKGSVCYKCEDVLFSGDTLFRETCGRVDFPGGDANEMQNSLNRLVALQGDLRVLPGHNEETTLSHERQYNPYIVNGV